MARKSGRRVWALAAFVALSLGGLAAAGMVVPPDRGDAVAVAAGRPAQPVRASRIAFAPAERVVTYTGTIRPRHEVATGFRVAGKIVWRGVEVGDRVSAGQLLARLDATDARLQAELAAAEERAARVDHDRALAEVARSRALFARGHLAQAGLDRAVSAGAQAASRLDRATRALALARNGLAYTELRATADGIVTATPAEAGQVVGAGTPVVSVARAGAVDVVFPLPETDRPLLEGGTARGAIWGDDGADHALVLRDISPDVDPQGRTYRVRMALDLPDGAGGFGRTVTVRVSAGRGERVAAVPLAAVLEDGTGPAVWRIAGDRVERVAVQVASVSDRVAAIRGALAEGDLVVSLGAHKIDPARPVRVVETTGATGG
jgi:RND family efflux transporter MFP subunit